MNKITIKGHDIPLKTGTYLLGDKIVVKLRVSGAGTKIQTDIVEDFKFDSKLKTVVEEIAIHKNSRFALCDDKFVYRLAFYTTAIFRKVDFSKSTDIPKSFNKKLSKMYNVKNFEVERKRLFKVEKYKPASYSKSMPSFNIDRVMKEYFIGEYQTRSN